MPDCFGSRLRELRKEYGLTQLKLAQNMNKAESTIRMWESGDNQPSHEALIRLAQIFQVSIDYLMGQSDLRRARGGRKEPDSLAGLAARPALRELLELANSASDEQLATLNRLARALLEK